MRPHYNWLFALALLPVAACSSNTPPPVAEAPAPPPALASADQAFINAAASSDAAEAANAQLAETNGRKPAVKKFAAQMLKDHGATSQQLMTIAQSKGMTLPTGLSDSATATNTKLQGEKGAAFDRDYARDQVMDHQMMISALQDEIANGQDADLKAFAQQNLPAIQKHLTEARALSGGGGHASRHPSRKS